MKILSAVAALLCVVVISARKKDEQIEKCLSSTGTDEGAFKEFMKGTKDDCNGIEAALKCIAEAKGIVKDGVVNISIFEGFAKDNEDALKQFKLCKEMNGNEICEVSKCFRTGLKMLRRNKKKKNDDDDDDD